MQSPHAALGALPLALLSGPQDPAPAAQDPNAAAASRAAAPASYETSRSARPRARSQENPENARRSVRRSTPGRSPQRPCPGRDQLHPPSGGSQGDLCLAGDTGRYVGPGQIQNSGASRSIALALDLTAAPSPTGSVSVTAGETWVFQGWYRDANPTITSNFTDAVSVQFQ